jgi:hypothetical protein
MYVIMPHRLAGYGWIQLKFGAKVGRNFTSKSYKVYSETILKSRVN